MGWGYYAPCIVYGFQEKQQEKIMSYDFLEKYDIERYALRTNKGECHGFIYGKSCETLETMESIDKNIVVRAFEIASQYCECTATTFLLALHGNLHVPEQSQYNPEFET